ncbi:hypothetical protein G3I59_35505 [Amycolatopsis rubida]|uniref:Uncharacterized protein n=1 Tax=Amycolatopsis rubida TaxID=112413 RepID=A0ABX0C0C6_9PSEU|nr:MULTISPECIES: hypothetical protein [Amycolatopsis]MYW95769.1 hypothetical protein [Amycolatopsis rubida]NEC60759.1 hypothetical protein [Amycolatopsis rubida]OAP19953.1 hypothetical protein A4R44_09324 [Amycolatopsis sp. M39]
MTAITGELPAGLVNEAIFAVHRWSVDGLNHLYPRHKLAEPGVVAPRCFDYGAPPTWWAVFPDELGPELDGTRDRSMDHRPCFSDADPRPVPRDQEWLR